MLVRITPLSAVGALIIICGTACTPQSDVSSDSTLRTFSTHNAFAEEITLSFFDPGRERERYANAFHAIDVDWIEADGQRATSRTAEPIYEPTFPLSHVTIELGPDPQILTIESGVFNSARIFTNDTWSITFSMKAQTVAGVQHFYIPHETKRIVVRYRIRRPSGTPTKWMFLDSRAIPFLMPQSERRKRER